MKYKKLASLIIAAGIFAGAACAPEQLPAPEGIVIEVAAASSAKLKAPDGVKISVDKNSAALSWNKVSGADAYRVYKYDAKKKKYVTYKTVTDTKCKVTGLYSGTKYKFKLAALVKENGKYVAQKAVTKSASTKKLAAPKKLTASAKSTTSVDLKWSKVNGADSYKIYKYDSKSKKYVGIASANTTNYTVFGLSSDTAYKFKVAALVNNETGSAEQTMSAEVSVKTSSGKVTRKF